MRPPGVSSQVARLLGRICRVIALTLAGLWASFLRIGLNMGILVYIGRAVVLLVCCISGSYRAKTMVRWKSTPAYRIVLEVGGGLVGLLVLAEICYLIFTTLTAPHSAPVSY
jgi:hypothetical protein